jgi:uncharacterized metal-binding protein
MGERATIRCAACKTKDCRNGKDCLDEADRLRVLYNIQGVARLHKAASAIEARHYCQEPRIREIMLFAKELEYRHLGLAFCVGLADEAAIIHDVFAADFEVTSVCCKVCGIPKSSLDLEQIDPTRGHETMCNPAGQATLLNEAETDLNIICGLCVGHDAIFSMISRAPVVTLIAKDRMLAHNPVGAIYSQYLRRTMVPENGH